MNHGEAQGGGARMHTRFFFAHAFQGRPSASAPTQQRAPTVSQGPSDFDVHPAHLREATVASHACCPQAVLVLVGAIPWVFRHGSGPTFPVEFF